MFYKNLYTLGPTGSGVGLLSSSAACMTSRELLVFFFKGNIAMLGVFVITSNAVIFDFTTNPEAVAVEDTIVQNAIFINN